MHVGITSRAQHVSEGESTLSEIGFSRIQQHTIASASKAIHEALDSIGYTFPRECSSIVIKPNLCYYWDYSTGETTDPRFVAAVIQTVRERISANVNISVAEADASAMKCEHAFRMLGYEKLAADHNIKLVNLSEDKSDPAKVVVGKRSFNLMIPRTISNADLRINIPKIKYSFQNIKLTCALKNIFGCNPYPKKFTYHPILEEAIVAVNKAMKFDLCLIDGNLVSGIKPQRLGLVMASRDPVAIDAAAARIAGIRPKSIKYLRIAHKEGLGDLNFIGKGMSMSYFEKRYPRRNLNKKVMGLAYRVVLRVGLGKRLGL